MATLAEINQTLISVDENTQTTSRGIQGFLDYLEEKKRDDLEAERERKAQRVEDSKAISQSTKDSGGGFKLPSLGLSGLTKGLAGLLTIGGALGLVKTLGTRLVKRGFLAALGVGLADTIADKLVTGNDEASNQMRSTLSNSISGGAIGLALFGKKGGFIGAITGALLTNPKTKQAFKDLGTNLDELSKKLFGGVDVKGTLANAVNTMSGLVGDGVTSINNLLTGESKNVGKDILGSLSVLGGLAFLVSPRLTSKAGKATLLGLLNAFKKAGPRGKAVAAILGFLGLSLAEDGVGPVGGDVQGPPAPPPKKGDISQTDVAVGSGLAYGSTKLGQKIVSKHAMSNRTSKITVGDDGTVTKGLRPADITKYRRLQKILKMVGRGALGGLAIAFELDEMRGILTNDNLSDREKAKQMAPILARSLGAAGFASVGASLGTAVGGLKGFALGGILGSIAGYFGGDYAGRLLAEYLLGGDPKLPADQAKQLQESMTNKLMKAAVGQGKKEFGTGLKTSSFQDISSTAGLGVKKLPVSSEFIDKLGSDTSPMYPNFDGPGKSGDFNMINSNNTSTIQSSAIAVGSSGATDSRDNLPKQIMLDY